MTFLQLVEKVLKEEKKPLNSEEIWEIAKKNGYDKELRSTGKTPWRTIGAQVYVNIRDKEDSQFKVTENRPKKFFLKNEKTKKKDLNEETKNKECKNIDSERYNEKEKLLHPFLSYYAFYYLNCYTKTLSHSKSEKKHFGEWVHPDIVGCSFQFNEWNKDVIGFSRAIGNTTAKIFSFELKRELNFSNLREAFFQSVSNSSWANESYLVAANILKDEDFRAELRRLSTSFGIGIIQIDTADPDASDIIFPAKNKETLDWDTINKLTMNPDFKEFMLRVKKDIEKDEIYKEQYDKVLEKNKLIATIQNKVKENIN